MGATSFSTLLMLLICAVSIVVIVQVFARLMLRRRDDPAKIRSAQAHATAGWSRTQERRDEVRSLRRSLRDDLRTLEDWQNGRAR